MLPYAVVVVMSAPAPAALALYQQYFMSANLAGTWRTLSEHKAFEWQGLLAPQQVATLRAQIAALLPAADVFVLPVHNQRKTMLVADMDSTIIQQECIDELADYCNVKPQVAAITEAAMNGQIDFVAALQQRVALLKGLSLEQIAQCHAQRIFYTAGAQTLLKTMTHHGAQALLISGGFECFVAPIAQQLGFTAHKANQLQVENNCLTGVVLPPFIDRAAKKHFMLQYAQQWQVDSHNIIAVGDGANDLDMLGAAGAGVAFYAKEIVANAAAHKVCHTNLTSLLYLQGYSDAEMIA